MGRGFYRPGRFCTVPNRYCIKLPHDSTSPRLSISSFKYSDFFTSNCAKIASYIKGKSAEEIREHFHIENDFTKEEEERVFLLSLFTTRSGKIINGRKKCFLFVPTNTFHLVMSSIQLVKVFHVHRTDKSPALRFNQIHCDFTPLHCTLPLFIPPLIASRCVAW